MKAILLALLTISSIAIAARELDWRNPNPPKDKFDPVAVVYDLDRIVDEAGLATGSNTHPMLNPGVGAQLRDGADDPLMAGPLGSSLIEALSDPLNGIILDSWIDADGKWQNDRRHGLQFKSDQLRVSAPATRKGIERFLASGTPARG